MARTVVIAAIIVTTLFCCNAQDGVYSYDSVRYDGKWKLDGWNKPPGFKARVTQKGLDFMTDIGVKMVRARIGQLSIPDIEGIADVSIATIAYRVSGMRITSISIPYKKLTPNSQKNGLELRTAHIAISLSGRWSYNTRGGIRISDSGTFRASGSSIALYLTLRIGVDSNGRPTIMSKPNYDCSFRIDGLDVDLQGGGSWFYNLFKGQIVDSIKGSLNHQVCNNVVNMVNTDLTKKLRTLTMTAPIENVAEIDYSLIQSPTFFGSLDTENKGEVYPLGRRDECPLSINTIPTDKNATSKMAFLWVTEYLPNSAGYVLQEIGFLKYALTPDNVPPEAKSYLNTSSLALRFMFPQINQLYPNMGMEINMVSTKAPMASITPDGIGAIFGGNTSLFAILPNKTLAFLFSLNVTITTSLDVSTNSKNITWKILSLSTDMSIIHSEIGTIDAGKLENIFNRMIKPFLVAKINNIGTTGVPLPQAEGFGFARPTISLGQGFVKIGTDLNYTPQQ